MEKRYYFVVYIYYVDDSFNYKVGRTFVPVDEVFNVNEIEIALRANLNIEIHDLIIVNYKEVSYKDYIMNTEL